ncbi:MAG TPA: hypothetical protein VHW23_28450 [Kofleriaceae bacterium]|nr:hypothetical protein [Kofleriaceae bacterium]
MTPARLGLFALFGRIAEPPEPRTGAWRIRTEDGREGVVLMEAGRICWANHELVARLSDEIERRYGVRRAAIEQVIRHCREQHQPFAASLVDHGYLTAPQLTSVLRDHTCRSILLLVRSGVRDCEWLPHQAGGYAPGTTISVPQAACYCVATVKGIAAEELEASLEDMLAGDAAGMLIHAGSKLPFAASAVPMTWPQLRRWLAWVGWIEELSPLPARSYLAGRGPSGGWLVWRGGSMLGLAVTTSEAAQRRLVLRVATRIASWTVEQVA